MVRRLSARLTTPAAASFQMTGDKPPSTLMLVPVRYEERVDRKNAMASSDVDTLGAVRGEGRKLRVLAPKGPRSG